jgi:hypothetical protein
MLVASMVAIRGLGRRRRRRRGSVAIQLALTMSVLLGVVALGTEVGFLYYKHRQMQSAADSAAFGAAVAVTKGYPTDYTVEARAIAASVGFVHGVDSVVVAVNRPPTLGPYAANAAAVEVIVSQPQYLGMASLFHDGLFDVGARAVAAVGTSAGQFCIIGLDTSASATVRIKNNGSVSSTTCGVGVNSNSNSALTLENGASIYGPVSVVGRYSLGGNAHLYYQTAPYPKQGGDAFTDPYAGVSFSASGATARTQPSGCTTCTLQPGRYSNGLNYTNGQTLNMAAGVYFIDTRFILNNSVKVNATSGVTIVINGNYAISVGNNVTLNLTAPTSGATAGIAMASIRTASSSVTQSISNNAIMNLTGALYFPNQILLFDNNSTINTPVCGQMVARMISIQNNANLKTSCTGTGVQQVVIGGPSKLVE